MCGVALPRLGFGSEPEVKGGRVTSAVARAEAEPEVAPPVREKPPIPVTGPSFLGLSQDQDGDRGRNVEYLLEDEPESGRGRMYLAVLLLIAAVAMLGWRWRGSGYFSRLRPAIVATPSPAPANTPDPPAPNDSGAATTAAPNTDSPSQGPPAAAVPGAPQESAPPVSSAANNETAKPAQSEASGNSVAGDSENLDPKTETPVPAATTPAPVEKPATTPVANAAPKPPKPAAATRTPADEAQDQLVADGEKYLYGNGVPQNCVRAEKSLLAAAGHANPRAQSILGTMYATGHCVGRDLPTAYRWFARASRQEPTNNRITRDLEVLWKQMTAGERKLAVNNRD
jgi:hypothetical protein